MVDGPRGSAREVVLTHYDPLFGDAEILRRLPSKRAAGKLLLSIDNRYGGLAAPRILELAVSCGCGLD